MSNALAILVEDTDGMSMREKVLAAEEIMKSRGVPAEIQLRHHFSDGVYAREITIPAGTLLTGKIHLCENMNFLMEGEISVLTERGIERLVAPATIVSPPGTKRIAYAHTEVIWTTVLGTNEKDPEKIEASFTVKTEQEWLAYQRLLVKEAA